MVEGKDVKGMLAPVHKLIRVDLPKDRAFTLFTQGIAKWWPLGTHSVGEDRAESCVFEGKLNGRIYEIMKDGSESEWGRVKTWHPPDEIVFSWHPGRNESTAQDVVVTFRSVGGGTEIELLHHGWELLGDRADEMRTSYDSGWDLVLGHYIKSAQR